MQFASGTSASARSRRWARRHERRARRNDVGIGDPAAQAKVAPAWRRGQAQLDRRPIRRTLQPTGKSLHGLLPGCRQFAGAWAAAQGWLRGEDIQFADLGEQVGDPLECCPEPERLLRGKK